MLLLQLENVTKRFDKRSIHGVSDVSLKIESNKIYSLVGPSGAGKTTLLKLIQGRIEPVTGTITKLKQDLEVSSLTQENLLDESLSVFDNLINYLPKDNGEEKNTNLVRMVLDQLELTNELHKLPSEISAGQRQRVLIAGALVTTPDLVILDEPFAHLDHNLRQEIISELFGLFKEKNITCLWVTHELRDALAFSDEVLVMNHSKIVQIDSPKEVYLRPTSLFSAKYFGANNTIAGTLLNATDTDIEISFIGTNFKMPKPTNFSHTNQKDILVCLRPEALKISDNGSFSGKVQKSTFYGSSTLLEVNCNDHNLFLRIPSTNECKVDQQISFDVNSEHIHCLEEI